MTLLAPAFTRTDVAIPGGARRAEIGAEAPDGRDDSDPGRSLGRPFERALDERFGRQAGPVGRIDDRADEGARLGIEPLEPRILSGHLNCNEQRRDNHEPLPPTVTTELGVPNSSSWTEGAAGSARHATPFTRNA